MKSDKREKLIAAAIEAFTERGLEQTKISDIVKLAGVAQGTFYLYFPSKLAIMPAIAEVLVEKIIANLANTLDASLSYEKQLKQYIDVSFAITEEYSEVIALTYAGLASSEYLIEWETIYEPYYLYMTEFLEKGIAAGEMTNKMNPRVAAQILIGLVEAASEQVYLYTEAEDEIIYVQKEEVFSFSLRSLGMKAAKE